MNENMPPTTNPVAVRFHFCGNEYVGTEDGIVWGFLYGVWCEQNFKAKISDRRHWNPDFLVTYESALKSQKRHPVDLY